MELSGFGNENYISPYGAVALQKRNSLTLSKTNSLRPDSFVKRHKKNSNPGEIFGGLLLAAAAVFGIYKGKGRIKAAFNKGKEYATTAFEHAKENKTFSTAVEKCQNMSENIKNQFETVKSKMPFQDKISKYTDKAKETFKNIYETINNFVKKITPDKSKMTEQEIIALPAPKD